MEYNDWAELIANHIDESYDTLVAATLLTGHNGASGMYADDAEMEKAADAAVRLRAKVRAARA